MKITRVEEDEMPQLLDQDGGGEHAGMFHQGGFDAAQLLEARANIRFE
jgi:hypothetical protein